MPGVLALVGGNEFNPGNEEQDRRLAAAAGAGPAFVVPTAAARQQPAASVAHAIAWFTQFGLTLEELPVLKRGDAASEALARRARSGGFFYLVGGDPGLVAKVLRGSVVWRAIFEAWRDGAALAGSSAGAMALGSHTLVRATWPDHVTRRPAEALGVLSETAILPHYNTFGQRWIESAQSAAPSMTLLGIDEMSAAVWDAGRWVAMGPGAVTVIPPPVQRGRSGRGAERTASEGGAEVGRFTTGQEIVGLRTPAGILPEQ